jgi:hypothetical protein
MVETLTLKLAMIGTSGTNGDLPSEKGYREHSNQAESFQHLLRELYDF